MFSRWLNDDPEMAVAMAGVKALTEVIKMSKGKVAFLVNRGTVLMLARTAETMMGLQIELEEAVKALTAASNSISLKSGCDLFLRYVTRTYLDVPDFELCKKKLINRGEQFTRKTELSRKRISRLGEPFIRDDSVVLLHGFSRVVLAVLMEALEKKKRFKVILTESRPESNCQRTLERLLQKQISVTLIPDTTVAYIMDQVDMVLVGAEAVVENGGVINRIGTYQIAIVAKALNKPCYVAAESFKFSRLYPLGEREIPNRSPPDNLLEFDKLVPRNLTQEAKANLKVESPMLDYTPPQYITLLFTDLGVLTPSAVSDELIKLYY
jgi:translation initiation factor eIF-2B subunit alpha